MTNVIKDLSTLQNTSSADVQTYKEYKAITLSNNVEMTTYIYKWAVCRSVITQPIIKDFKFDLKRLITEKNLDDMIKPLDKNFSAEDVRDEIEKREWAIAGRLFVESNALNTYKYILYDMKRKSDLRKVKIDLNNNIVVEISTGNSVDYTINNGFYAHGETEEDVLEQAAILFEMV